MFDNRDQLEFALSQYLDGTLSPTEAAEVESRLRADPEAAQLLQDFRQLDTALKAPPILPNINWTTLAQRISANIDEDPATSTQPLRLPWLGLRRLAIAACIALATGVAVYVTTKTPSNSSNPSPGQIAVVPTPKSAHVGYALITGPAVETSAAPALSQISIGPAPAIAATPSLYHAQAILTRPATIVIQSDSSPDLQEPAHADLFR